MSHYDVLGASPNADAEELRRAFVAMARRFHPDRHIGAQPSVRREAEQRMRQITEAWAVLGDRERRRRYDLGLGDRLPRSGSAGSAGSGAATPAAGRSSGPGSGPTGGTETSAGQGAASTSAAERDWRAYASPGADAGPGRSLLAQMLLLSPVLLLFAAGMLGLLGMIVGWPPFFGFALVCVIGAATGFFMLPIWAMTRGNVRRGGRGPKRSY